MNALIAATVVIGLPAFLLWMIVSCHRATRIPPRNKPRKGVLRAPSKDCVRMYPDV